MSHESGHILIPPKRVSTKTKKTKKEKVASSGKSKKRR